VHDAEAVGDESVAERGELLGEGATLGVVLRGLPGVEAQVLDDGDVAVLEGAPVLRGLPTVSRANATGLPSSSEALSDRLEAVLRVGRAVGATEVGARDDARALVDEVLRVGRAARIRPSSVMTPL
jgi:hypothetical protein